MSSSFSVGGLMTGLDTGSIVSQLMAIERQPVTRLQNQIKALNSQKSAIGELRTQLQTLRAKIQDFRLLGVFSQYTATTSDNKVLTASISGPNPVVGSYAVNVTQMASATVAIFRFRLSDSACSHRLRLSVLFLHAFNTARAPWINSVRR